MVDAAVTGSDLTQETSAVGKCYGLMVLSVTNAFNSSNWS